MVIRINTFLLGPPPCPARLVEIRVESSDDGHALCRLIADNLPSTYKASCPLCNAKRGHEYDPASRNPRRSSPSMGSVTTPSSKMMSCATTNCCHRRSGVLQNHGNVDIDEYGQIDSYCKWSRQSSELWFGSDIRYPMPHHNSGSADSVAPSRWRWSIP